MQVIRDHLHQWDQSLPARALHAERATLNKRRWRGVAEDGTEFGFDLTEALEDGDVFFQSNEAIYILRQLPEPVIEIALDEDPAAAARLGWMIGNLHFPAEIFAQSLVVLDDPAVRQALERERVPFTSIERVFRPLRGGHFHEHQHHH